MIAPVLTLDEDTAMLALEALTVIGIRLTQLSCGGPAAQVGAERMVTEKVAAFGEAAALLATGGSVHAVVKDYREHVQANVSRLTR
jgi:ABC-type taurine transport system substrate-binding protein